MKTFIITDKQVQDIGNVVANIPTMHGMKIIDILRALPEVPEPKAEELKISE